MLNLMAEVIDIRKVHFWYGYWYGRWTASVIYKLDPSSKLFFVSNGVGELY